MRMRAVDTRERILKAASELFALQGYKSTSMEAIADLAGTSRSLVFFHFRSKELLLDAVVGTMLGTYRQVIDAAIGDRVGLQALRSLVTARQTVMAVRHQLARLVYLLIGEAIGLNPALASRFVALDREMAELIGGWLGQAKESGELPAELNAPLAGSVVLSAFHGNSVQWLLDPEGFDVGEADRAIVEIFELIADHEERRVN